MLKVWDLRGLFFPHLLVGGITACICGLRARVRPLTWWRVMFSMFKVADALTRERATGKGGILQERNFGCSSPRRCCCGPLAPVDARRAGSAAPPLSPSHQRELRFSFVVQARYISPMGEYPSLTAHSGITTSEMLRGLKITYFHAC